METFSKDAFMVFGCFRRGVYYEKNNKSGNESVFFLHLKKLVIRLIRASGSLLNKVIKNGINGFSKFNATKKPIKSSNKGFI